MCDLYCYAQVRSTELIEDGPDGVPVTTGASPQGQLGFSRDWARSFTGVVESRGWNVGHVPRSEHSQASVKWAPAYGHVPSGTNSAIYGLLRGRQKGELDLVSSAAT